VRMMVSSSRLTSRHLPTRLRAQTRRRAMIRGRNTIGGRRREARTIEASLGSSSSSRVARPRLNVARRRRTRKRTSFSSLSHSLTSGRPYRVTTASPMR
jgi:hypothetical protein